MPRTSGGTGGGGGGLPEVFYSAQAIPATGGWTQISDLTDKGSFVLDVALGFVGKKGAVTLPVTTYGVGAEIVQFGGCGVDNLPASANAFQVTMIIAITSLDGLNAAFVLGTRVIPGGTDHGLLLVGDFNLTATAGVDLAWDATNGWFTTTAGGVYGVVVTYNYEYASA